MGQSGRVVFQVTSPTGTRIQSVTADLIGDGRAGWTIETHDEDAVIAGIRYFPRVAGTHNLVVSALDEDSCVGSTGLRRNVTVTPP